MNAWQDIEVGIEDPVGIIRLNRPEKLNAVTYPMLAEIRRAVDELAADPRVVGIVITGAGRGFCAGLDSQALVEVTAHGGESRRTETAASTETPGMWTYLYSVPKPVIAAVNGVAAGGGLMLALMADMRIASTNASFTTVFLKRGLISEHGSSWILSRLVGPGRAVDLLWTSERIDAARALEYGMVEYVVEPEELLDRAKDYVRRIAGSSAPGAMAETKRLVYAAMGKGIDEAMREAEVSQWQAVASPDATEGARALIEKRDARFARLGAAEVKS
ncbi:MAG: enoyl-CoA hydratase/isomerase family protein [Anaerolineales bacterium]